MCTDGIPVIFKMHKLIKNELWGQYRLTLSQTHKIELVIQDAFEESLLKSDCDIDYTSINYLLKKANIR